MTADSFRNSEGAVETFHRVVEAFKHGFSVRTNLGDPDVESQQFKDDIATVSFKIIFKYRIQVSI